MDGWMDTWYELNYSSVLNEKQLLFYKSIQNQQAERKKCSQEVLRSQSVHKTMGRTDEFSSVVYDPWLNKQIKLQINNYNLAFPPGDITKISTANFMQRNRFFYITIIPL